MPDDQNTTQNPISEKNSIPASPQEPNEPVPINTAHSEPSDALPEALEGPGDGFEVKSNDIPLSNSLPTEAPKEPEIPSQNELNSELKNTLETETAQIPVNEPLEEPETSQNEQAKPVREQPKSSFARELLITA